MPPPSPQVETVRRTRHHQCNPLLPRSFFCTTLPPPPLFLPSRSLLPPSPSPFAFDPCHHRSPTTAVALAIALVAVARLHCRLHCCCRRHSPPLRHPPPSSPLPSPTLSPLPSPSSPSLALVAIALAAVALALFVARHPRRHRHRRRPCPCRTHPLLHPLRRRSTATLVTIAMAISSLTLFVAALIIRRALSLFVVACRPPPDFDTPVAS